jgi:OPA family glycerol-3-phosphate transporter-like MFS transporter
VEKIAEQSGIQEEIQDTIYTEKRERAHLWRMFFAAGLIPILLCVVIQGVLKDGVTTWVPTYISEIYQLGSVTSILATTLLPVINLGGVYTANYLNNRFFHNEIKTSGVCFFIASLALVFLVLFGKYHVMIAALMLGLTTTGMIGVNTMLISLLPLHFARIGKVSTVTGVLNSTAYAGSALSSYGIGVISQNYGWNKTIFIWFLLAVVGFVTCILIKGTWEREVRKIIKSSLGL